MTTPGTFVLVGPTHPYSGGIAQHTTRLALELERHGERVVVESWRSQYPKFLYPGSGIVPDDEPEIGVPESVQHTLAWFSPLSWWRVGRRHRNASLLTVSVPTPLHAIPYLVMFWAAGKKPTRVAVAHNALPHERFPGDRWLMKLLLKKLDRVLVHSEGDAQTLRDIGSTTDQVVIQPLPSPWSTKTPEATDERPSSARLRLLFFGTIRHYKGLDLLLDAMTHIPQCELTVAGEFWEKRENYQRQIEKNRLNDRVTIRPGYVKSREFTDLFSSADVLVLPYRSATGSIVSELAFDFGLPVIASHTGSLADGVADGINGYVTNPGDVASLKDAINRCLDPKTLRNLQEGAKKHAANRSALWDSYVRTLLGNERPEQLP
jgi:glycosyltransferase involved in cell wall biosynthesis